VKVKEELKKKEEEGKNRGRGGNARGAGKDISKKQLHSERKNTFSFISKFGSDIN
jgi:hypothetical protein